MLEANYYRKARNELLILGVFPLVAGMGFLVALFFADDYFEVFIRLGSALFQFYMFRRIWKDFLEYDQKYREAVIRELVDEQ